jgi:hypothetical protein
MAAIGQMFSGAKGIMTWLADCAREVASYSPPRAGAAAAQAQRRLGPGQGQQPGEVVLVGSEDGSDGGGGKGGGKKGKGKGRGGGSSDPRDNLGRPVKWTTPLGLPVTQPYFKTASHVVATVSQNFSVRALEGQVWWWSG